MRSRLHPLVSGFAELGVLSVMVRPSVPHACKHCPSVRLLRRLQFCKSGPIRLRSLDRLSLAKRGKCAAGIFTQGSKRPSWPFSATAAFRATGMPDLATGTTADSASASRGDTAVLGLEDADTTAKAVMQGVLLQSELNSFLGSKEDNIRSRIDKYGVFRRWLLLQPELTCRAHRVPGRGARQVGLFGDHRAS